MNGMNHSPYCYNLVILINHLNGLNMDANKESKRKRKYYRPAHYPYRLQVSLPADNGKQIDKLADQLEISAVEVIRRSVAIGLPYLKDRVRKQLAKDRKKQDPQV